MKQDYRITIHAGGSEPETKLELRDLPELIQRYFKSRWPRRRPAGSSSVTQTFLRILGDLARENESKFGFDGRRITYTSLGRGRSA